MKKRRRKKEFPVGASFVWVPVVLALIYLGLHAGMFVDSLYCWGGIIQALVLGQ